MSTTHRPIRQRLAIAASAFGVLLAMLPASAFAGGAAVTAWGQLNYVDASQNKNRLTVTPLASGQFRLVDTAGVYGGDGCTNVSFTEVKCSGILSFYVNVGNGDDEVNLNVGAPSSPGSMVLGANGIDRLNTGAGVDYVYGGDAGDTIDAGAGADRIDAGPGADFVAAREGAADNIKCGTESDGGTADTSDTVEADCESVAVAQVGGSTGPVVGTTPVPKDPTDPDPGSTPGDTDGDNAGQPGGTSTPIAKVDPLANPLPVVIPAQAPRLDANANVASVQVACPAGTGRCKGIVKLEVAEGDLGKAGAAAAAAKLVTIGSARFVAKAGTKPIVKVRLSRRGRRRVIRGRKKQRCRITVTTTSPIGKTLVTRRTVTLERRTPKRGSKR